MTVLARTLALLFALLPSLLACGEPEPSGPAVGSNSNWLKACTASAQCDDAPVCECGCCTERCDSDADCEGLQNARCAPAAEPAARSACGGEVPGGSGLCLPRCTPGSCGDGQACVDGACVLAALPDVALCSDVAVHDMERRAREDQLLALLQATRTTGGVVCGSAAATQSVPALRLDARLICAARVLAADFDANGVSGLEDSQGRSTEERLSAVGYRQQRWYEAFALAASTAERARDTMLAMTEPCSSLTDAQYVDVGVGSAGDTWVVTLGVQ